MKTRTSDAVHVWLILHKTRQAVHQYAVAEIQQCGLGDSGFRVLEALFHKGPLPVNTIGPKVNLTPGSISVAVDRLHRKGFVSRVESREDRRIRVVALTPAGKKLIAPVYRKHAATIRMLFAGLSSEQLQQLEKNLKQVGRRAQALSIKREREIRLGSGS